MASNYDRDLQTVIGLVKSMLNSQLKDVLRSEYLPVSGTKAVLQGRIIEYIRDLIAAEHFDRYNRLKKFIYATTHQPLPSTPTQTLPPANHAPHTAPPAYPPPSRSSYPDTMTPPAPRPTTRIQFKDSPFYTPFDVLTPAVECKVREHTRDSVELKINLGHEAAAKLQTDSSFRVMIYCAADNGLTNYTKCDIAFPHQVELKVNLDDVKANLRGLKNKPGTTRPADITQYIRKKAGYPNNVVMTYALTQKASQEHFHSKYYVVAMLVRKESIDHLVRKLQTRRTISSDQVVREMRNRAQDSDIVATSSVMSLKCPLSTLRISVPCRSSVCTHNQCFDAASYLQLQEQAPTWTCPVCNKYASFEALQIDQYVDNILKSTSSDVEQVTVEPDGTWSRVGESTSANGQGNISPAADDDDDLVEIQDSRVTNVKREPNGTSGPFHSPLSLPSREQSSVPSGQQSSKKRPASQVIDLTGSDDDEPPRPAKRFAFDMGGRGPRPGYSGHNGYSNSSSPGGSSFYY